MGGGPGVEEGRHGTVGEVASCQCGGALAHYEEGGAGCCVGELVTLFFHFYRLVVGNSIDRSAWTMV